MISAENITTAINFAVMFKTDTLGTSIQRHHSDVTLVPLQDAFRMFFKANL